MEINKKLEIGYLTTSLSAEDGWGRYSKSLVESVSELANVQVLICSQGLNESKKNIKVIEVLPAPNKRLVENIIYQLIYQLKVFFQTLKYLRNCNVIHILVEPFAPAAALACLLIRSRLVITLHGNQAVPPDKISAKKIAMCFAYKVASITTTGSFNTESRVRKVVRFGECRFIPNGVDVSIFRILPHIKKQNFLLTVGALRPRKGADVLVNAFAILSNKFPNLRVKLVGTAKDEQFMHYLKNKIQDLGIQNRVDFLGVISDDELVRLYNECVVFVLAAREAEETFEGFPMVYYEANACGVPVVTTRGFGSEYAIKNGENGFITNPDSPVDIAIAIEKIIADDNLAEFMRQRALIEANNHCWRNIAPKLIELYKDALKK